MSDIKYKRLLIWFLLIIIGILYISYISIDSFNMNSNISTNILRYISIILCFFISSMIGTDKLNRMDRSLLQGGMFVTIFADLSLVILDYHIMGVFLFYLVQIIYYLRYKRNKKRLDIKVLIKIWLTIILGYFILGLFNITIDFVIIIGIFYSLCLALSVRESIKALKNKFYPKSNGYIIVIGMLLFLLCDINVAITYLTEGRFITIHNTSSVLIWVFYLPSQVLLALSGYKFNLPSNEKL